MAFIWKKIIVVRDPCSLKLAKMAAKLQFGRPSADGTKSIVKPMRFKVTVDAQKIVDSLRPALEPQLDRIRSHEVGHFLRLLKV